MAVQFVMAAISPGGYRSPSATDGETTMGGRFGVWYRVRPGFLSGDSG